jgi:hypothetical protein
VWWAIGVIVDVVATSKGMKGENGIECKKDAIFNDNALLWFCLAIRSISDFEALQ